MSKPVLKKSEIISLIKEKGFSRKELADHYKISLGEVNHILKVFNIKLRAKKVTYLLEDDVEEPVTAKNNLAKVLESTQLEIPFEENHDTLKA